MLFEYFFKVSSTSLSNWRKLSTLLRRGRKILMTSLIVFELAAIFNLNISYQYCWLNMELQQVPKCSFLTCAGPACLHSFCFFPKKTFSFLNMGTDEPVAVLNHDSTESDSINTKRKVCLYVK